MASSNKPTSAGLYFAFGSNMHLRQMAKRCPRSTLDSKGRLYNYRWQINYRGVANIVAGGPEDFVEGLLFAVTPRDVATLDRNEGVSKGFYRRVHLQVERKPLSVALPPKAKARITAAAAWLEEHTRKKARSRISLPPKSATSTPRTKEKPAGSRRNRPDFVGALVYISDETRTGRIRLEYVARMRSAMFDAQKLGVSKTYLDKCLDPLVSARDEETALAERAAAGRAAVERAAIEHGEFWSDRRLRPAGRIGGERDEENRRRERRHALDEVDDTAREQSRRHRHRREGSRELRRYRNDPRIDPRARDSQITSRQREEVQRRNGGGQIGGPVRDSMLILLRYILY